MQLHEATELKEAYSLSQANAALKEGCTLLAVIPGANGVTYVLGKPKVGPGAEARAKVDLAQLGAELG